jgi:hypothetical protein
MTENNERSEADLLDVLKGRVVAGQPIFVVGNLQGAVAEVIEATHQQIADETGVSVRVVQSVELPALREEREYKGMLPDVFLNVRASSEAEAQLLMVEEVIRQLRADHDMIVVTN